MCSSTRGPGDGAVLGDVADEEGRHPGALGEGHQPARHLAHLGDAARRAAQLRQEHGLDGVDHQRARASALSAAASTFSASVSANRCRLVALHAAAARRASSSAAATLRPRRRAPAPSPREPVQRREQQRATCRCPGRRPAAPASPPPRRRPAPGPARRCRCCRRASASRVTSWSSTGFVAPARRAPRRAACRRAFASASSTERVPRAAVRALPQPLRRLVAAGLTGEVGLRLRHGLESLSETPDVSSPHAYAMPGEQAGRLSWIR